MNKNLTKGLYPRKVNKSDYNELVPVNLGGTDGITKEEAVSNLNLIPVEKIASEGGIVPLRNDNFIDEQYFDIPAGGVVTIEGKKSIGTDEIVTFKINNYSTFINYIVTASLGIVSRNNDIVTYTAPSIAATDILTINDSNKTLSIFNSYIRKPTITTPVNTTIDVGPSILTSSNSFLFIGANDTHESSQWQLSTDVNFTTIVKSSNNSTNLVNWTIVDLEANTTYFLRVRHKGVIIGYSEWSNTISFTTLIMFLPSNNTQKIITSPRLFYKNFGSSIALSLDKSTLIIGGKEVNGGGSLTTSGTIYVHHKVNNIWEELTRLNLSLETPFNVTNNFVGYGISLAISSNGNTIAVGVSSLGVSGYIGSGRLFILQKSGNTWVETNIFKADNYVLQNNFQGDLFGHNVRMNDAGNIISVLCVNEYLGDLDEFNNNIGSKHIAIYIYKKDINGSWNLFTVIRPTMVVNSVFDTLGLFNIEMSEDGDTIVTNVKTYNSTTSAYDYKIHIYKLISNNYSLVKIIDDTSDSSGYINTDYQSGMNSAFRLSKDGTKLFIKATQPLDGFPETIKYYIDNGTDWVFDSLIQQLPFGIYRYYSFSIFNNGNSIIASYVKSNILEVGFIIYSYSNGSWIERLHYITPENELNINGMVYGHDLAINSSGTECFISDVYDPGYGSGDVGDGAVYVYSA